MMSILKRLFGIRNANKGGEDTQVDFEVKDLKKGFILDYDFKSWEVTDVAVYTWDNGVKDYEYTIFEGVKKLYLNYESSTENLSIYWDAKMSEVWSEATGFIRKGIDITDKTFEHLGDSYFYSAEGAASVSNSKESYHMQNWLFQSEENGLYVSFNKYEDNSMEAYLGKKLSRHAVSNILKR